MTDTLFMPVNTTIHNLKRLRIQVQGRVQGVGFRPTVYRYAVEYGLIGSVRNDSTGVIIEIQGSPDRVQRFLDRLLASPPPQARITDFRPQAIPPEDGKSFTIETSTRSGRLDAGMPPDIATCEKCRQEMFDPQDRRQGYAFLNCTNCGPRFTIIDELPYDRHQTSMSHFNMCPACLKEYNDPANRRFDAQPNACPECGPQMQLRVADGEVMAGDPVQKAVELLRGGAVLAVKGLGGYHLCCHATSDKAVQTLRRRKHRPSKALAVMFNSLAEIRQNCAISEAEEAELMSSARPIVIIKQRRRSQLSAAVSPDTKDVGALLPYTPLHHLLLAGISPLVMTSANLSEEPIVCTREGLEKLTGTVVDYILDHNRVIARRCDDSVLKMNRGQRLFIRRSRGFVPNPVPLPFAVEPVLACGADLKNTFCVTSGGNAYLSQHIGDLQEFSASTFYRDSIADMLSLLQVNPRVIAHDLHPAYQSTAYALSLEQHETLAVQHHHAHIASCMVDNAHTDRVLGVALDGTGYGPDNTVWGGEFILADLHGFKRLGHFRQYPMPGGEAAARHPERMAFSILVSEGFDLSDDKLPPALRHIPGRQRQLLRQMIKRGVNAPLTSSAGRLFDAAAALLGLCGQADYEGQAPMRLQAAAVMSQAACSYHYTISDDGEISFSETIRDIIDDLRNGAAPGRVAGMFHRTVADAVIEMCGRLRRRMQTNVAALSGGVFQNELLLNLIADGLQDRGFRVLQHHNTSPNDAGIALGQAAIAGARQRTNPQPEDSLHVSGSSR